MWLELTPAYLYAGAHKPTKNDMGWCWQQDNLFYGNWTYSNLPRILTPKVWDIKGYSSMSCVLT